MSSDAYQRRGVSATKDDVKAAIKTQSKGLFPGAFCKIIEDPVGDPNYCSVMHADGAGTKSIVAYLFAKEFGRTDFFYGLAQDSLIMNIDDLICVGAVDNFLVSNTIGRNAHRVSREILTKVIEGYEKSVKTLRSYGINVTLSGGETADVGDLVATIIVDSTVFVRLPRKNIINCDNIKPGDVIIGLASFGKAVYEEKENSGIGSNGLTAARHILLSHLYADKYPESYSPTIDKKDVYCGPYKLEDKLPGTTLTIGEAILSPTRTYAPVIKEILDEKREKIHGIIHCSGGGQIKCRNFGKGIHYIKDNLFETPPIFKAIQDAGKVDMAEMFQIFNMGHRLEIFTKPEDADFVIEKAKKFGIEAKIIGKVEANENEENRVTIIHNKQTFEYGQ